MAYTLHMHVTLKRHSSQFWVSQLSVPFDEIIDELNASGPGNFWSLTRTAEEISLVSEIETNTSFVQTEGPWVLFQVEGVLDFGLVGILNSLTKPMADAGISVFVISTFNTDYILVKSDIADTAEEVWMAASFPVKKI